MSIAQTPISGNTPPILAQGAPVAADIARSLEYADELYGSTYDFMQRRYAAKGSCIGPDALNLFCQALYGQPFQDARDYHYTDNSLGFLGLNIKLSHHLKYIEHLVDFVRDGRANEPIDEFIRGFRNVREWTFGEQGEGRTQAWSVFWNALSFNPNIPLSQSLSFRSRISELFQLSPPNAATPALKLKAGVMDLERLDIKVVPTLYLDEHMTLEEDTLRLLQLTSESWNLCLTYQENVVAQALEIDTLGREVLGSLFTLYGEGALMRKAGKMDLVLAEDNLELAMWTRLLRECYSKVTPNVLAGRTLALRNLVEERRSWWPTFTRDIRLQTSTQPILFYGSILAVLSVMCSVIQAVLAIRNAVIAK